jgi:hypothetical protein
VGSWEEMDWEALRDYDEKVRVEGGRPARPVGCRKPTVEEGKRARNGEERHSYVTSVTAPPPVLFPSDKGKKRALDHDPEVDALLDTGADTRPHSPKRSRASSQNPPDAPQHFLRATAPSAKKTSNTTIATRVSKRAASPDAPVPTRLKRTRTELAVDAGPDVRTVRRSRSTTKAATIATAATSSSSAKHSKAKTVQGKPLTMAVDGPAPKAKVKSRSRAQAPAAAATADDKNPKTKSKKKAPGARTTTPLLQPAPQGP